ncbi:MAG: response regulator transcription factor [Flavobacteriales bacterium]|jgi:DNA-binding NarL/FixJ family response regulator|nr:MAG: response regulator transcription factor [Flavobacteriales bacterium]
MASIKLLLADHGELALLALRAVFEAVPGVEVAGSARDGISLQALLVRHRPDVVLIDHTSDGFAARDIREGLKRAPRARFVAISHAPSSLAIMNAVRAGATSYVKKDCDLKEIIDAVSTAAKGQRFFCGKVLETLRRAGHDAARFAEEPLSCAPVILSDRECEIIGLIAEGNSYTRIAERLHLSAHTITTHRRNIMQKLGVNSTAAIVLYAVRNGLASPNHFLFNAGR